MDTHSSHMPGTSVLIAIGAVIVLAVASIALLGGRNVAEYAPGSPEAAAQAYVQALFDGDSDAAYAMLSPELQRHCRALETDLGWTDSSAAVFENVRTRAGRVTIDVVLTGTGFEPGRLPIDQIDQHEIDSQLSIEKSDGEWRIVAGDWPLYRCAWR